MKYSESQALSKLAAYCSKAERAKSDIRTKLKMWGLDLEVTERIISRLEKENFLDEYRYCKSFIKDKLRFNKWGKVKIVFELKRKQISPSIINSCFEEIDNNDFQEPLMQLLITKSKSVKAKDTYEKKAKLIRFALGRGYSIEQIKTCLSKILKDDNEEFDEFFC